MKIIVVKGEEDAGKTTAINLMYFQLKQLGATECPGHARKPVRKNPFDFKCILEYKGQKIAFYSMGDNVSYVKRAVRRYSKCDYLIIANRNFEAVDLEIKKYDPNPTEYYRQSAKEFAEQIVQLF